MRDKFRTWTLPSGLEFRYSEDLELRFNADARWLKLATGGADLADLRAVIDRIADDDARKRVKT